MFGMFPFMFNMLNDLGNLSNMLGDVFYDNMTTQISNQGSLSNFMEGIQAENSRFNIELKEYDESYLIKGRLPGVSAKDIDVDFANDTITLSIKNKRSYSNGSNIMVTVVNYGDDYIKRFPLKKVDYSKMKVSFKDSILLMSFPKIKEIKTDEIIDQDVIIDVDDYTVE